jgi:hypothetical protein
MPFFVRLTMPASVVSTLTFSSSPSITWEGGLSPVLPPVNQSIWFRFFYNGSVLVGQWSTGTATQVNLGLLPGTLTDGDLCTYTASGTLFACNTAPYTLAGLGGINLSSAITGFVSGAGSISTGDTLLSAIDKLDGNIAGKAAVNADTTGLTAAHVPPVVGNTGTTHTLAAPADMWTCSTTCTVTAIAGPAAGSEYQFCIENGTNVGTVITLAMPASVMIENQARTAYGTAGTGHGLTSGGAVKDAICIHSVDGTHYNINNAQGTWTAY